MQDEKRNYKITDKLEFNLRKFWKANFDYKSILKKDQREYSFYYFHFLKLESKYYFY